MTTSAAALNTTTPIVPIAAAMSVARRCHSATNEFSDLPGNVTTYGRGEVWWGKEKVSSGDGPEKEESRARLSVNSSTDTIVYVNPALWEHILNHVHCRALAACCLTFASELYLKRRELGPEAFAPLHSGISRKLYTTRHYGPMLKILVKAGALEIARDGYFRPGYISKSYRLAEQFCSDVRPYSHGWPALQRRIDRRFAKASYAAMSGKAREWIVQSYHGASFAAPVEDLLRSYAFKSPEARYGAEQNVQSVISHRMRFTVSDRTGRVYYPVTNLPKTFRETLFLDGEETVEIDAAASQPTLLATLYPTATREQETYLEYVRSPDFYEQVGAWATTPLTRGEAKREFFAQIAYGSVFCEQKYPLWPHFEARFPELSGLMREIKRQGNDALPVKMQKREADITIKGACGECAERGIPVLPVHDSLICKASDAVRVSLILVSHWESVAGFPARVRIARNSI